MAVLKTFVREITVELNIKKYIVLYQNYRSQNLKTNAFLLSNNIIKLK